MSTTTEKADDGQAQRIGSGYAKLLAGIARDFGVTHDAAASIVARAGHWSTSCDACGTRYGPDGSCSTCEKAEPEAVEAPVWKTSTDEERWSGGEEYPTEAEAIAGGPEEHDLEPGARFFVGRKCAPSIHGCWADQIIEQIGMNAYEACGDVSEGWPDNTKEQEKELDDEIERVIDAWLDRHGLRPTFYTLAEVSEHRAPDPEATQVLPPSVLRDEIDGTGPTLGDA